MKPLLKNILLIDDNNNDLELAQYHLNKKFDGLMFMIAKSKADFDDRVTWIRPDLVICDFDLPDCTGLDLLIAIKDSWDTPFIFMSGALNDSDILSKSILNGANGYVLKENIKSLPDIVDQVLNKEYELQNRQAERDMILTKIKLKISKSIQLIESGADTKSILENLKLVSKTLSDVWK